MTVGPVPHWTAPPTFSGYVVVPHFWIVHLVSLIAPKRIEPVTWNCSHFEYVLEENMVNFQNKGWRAPRGPHRDPRGPKMAKIMNLLDFATVHFTQVKYFCYSYTVLRRREW